MKRLLLGSLLSCMLVGQVVCNMQENLTNMGKGALNAGAIIASAALLGGTLNIFVFGRGRNEACQAASVFALFPAVWIALRGVDRIEKATDLNDDATNQATVHARNASFGAGQMLGALGSSALIGYLYQNKLS